MSLSHSLSNALSGLVAVSRRAEVTSSNIANATTEGYARREVLLSSSSVGERGAGVKVLGIDRIVNQSILSDRRLADADVAGDENTSRMLQRLEMVTGSADSEMSLAAKIAALENALVTAGSDPSSDIRLGAVLGRLKDVTNTLSTQSDRIQALRVEADGDIAQQVDMLNTTLGQVAKINRDITRARTVGADATALLDQRQVAIDKIAKILPIREFQRQGGQIGLTTTSGLVLLDGKPAELGFERTQVITADMTRETGGLSGLTLNGAPLTEHQFERISTGSLSAAFALRDTTLTNAQRGLDEVAQDLINRFQNNTIDPTLTPATAGLLTDQDNYSDGSDIEGLAQRIAVNTAVDPDKGGEIWRLRDGIGSISEGPVGDTKQIDRWLKALSEGRPLASGGVARSAVAHAGAIRDLIGTERVNAEDRLSFSTARWTALRDAEMADGVDTDAELQELLQIEQAYAANARVMQTVETLMRKLMEL